MPRVLPKLSMQHPVTIDNVRGWKVDIVHFIPPYIHVLNMNYLYIIPFVCAVQTAEHNSAHLKWKIKSCQTIASNLLLHTMQWQFIVTKNTTF